MYYINQLDYPEWLYVTRTKLEGIEQEKGKTTTVKSSGCGLCSAIMVADRLLVNHDFDLRTALRLSYESQANEEKGTDLKRLAPAFAERLNLRYVPSSDLEDLRHCLRTGGAAIANVGGDREGYTGVFSHGGHYIAVINEEPDGRFAILDPSYKENKFEEDGRKGKVEIKNGVIALCEPEVLAKDTENRAPSYYLFWRA